MSILAYLPTRLLRHLQFIVGPASVLLVANDWADVGAKVQNRPISVAVIDPSNDVNGVVQLEQLIAGYPSLPVIAYVPLTPLAFGAVYHLAQNGLRHAVLYSYDDGAARFVSLLDSIRMSPITARLTERLRPRMAVLPIRLSKTVENVFAEPHRYSNAKDIATQSKIPLVTVHRALHSAGFATPKKLFVAAKMIRAYSYLGDPGHSVQSVSRKLGYRQTRILSDHSNDVFGMNPSRLRAYLTENQVLDRIVDYVNLESECSPAGIDATEPLTTEAHKRNS